MWYLDPVPRNGPLVWSVAGHPSSPKGLLIADCCLDSFFYDTSISICCAGSWELVKMPNLRSHRKLDWESILTSSPDGSHLKFEKLLE